jgi:hypothetical protein
MALPVSPHQTWCGEHHPALPAEHAITQDSNLVERLFFSSLGHLSFHAKKSKRIWCFGQNIKILESDAEMSNQC